MKYNTFRKQNGRLRAGFIWLRVWVSGGEFLNKLGDHLILKHGVSKHCEVLCYTSVSVLLTPAAVLITSMEESLPSEGNSTLSYSRNPPPLM